MFLILLAESPEAKMLGRATLLIKKAATSQDPSKGKGRKTRAGRGGKAVTPQAASGEAQTSLVVVEPPAQKPSEPMVVSSSSSEGEGLVFAKRKAPGVSKRPGGEKEGEKKKRLRHSSPGGDGDLRTAGSPLRTTSSLLPHKQTQPPQPQQQQQQQQQQPQGQGQQQQQQPGGVVSLLPSQIPRPLLPSAQRESSPSGSPSSSSNPPLHKTSLPLPGLKFHFPHKPTRFSAALLEGVKRADSFLKRRLEAEKAVVQGRADNLSAVKRAELVEGVRSLHPAGAILDGPALAKRLVPRLGRELAPFGAEAMEDMALSLCELNSEKWAISSSKDPLLLTHAVKQQLSGVSC